MFLARRMSGYRETIQAGDFTGKQLCGAAHQQLLPNTADHTLLDYSCFCCYLARIYALASFWRYS
jgi:hypothetical protein